MSKKQNELLRSLRIIGSQIRCNPPVWRGRQLPEDDRETVSDALFLLLAVWVECFSPEVLVGEFPGWVARWAKALTAIDLESLILCLKDCDELILSRFRDQGQAQNITSYDGFKHHLSQKWSFCGAIIAPAKQDIHAFLSDGKKLSFVRLHQAFSFILRLNLKDADELDCEMLAKFRANQSRLNDFDDSCNVENQIIRSWFEGSPNLSERFRPRHGSGAVAEQSVHCTADKYRCGVPDAKLSYCLAQDGIDCYHPYAMGVVGQTARIELVPKSATAKRTITMEPATRMYYQQGIRDYIYNFLRRHRYLRRRISVQDQTRSRDLALYSSVDGLMSTIDLSMASDSITYTHFKRMFAGTPIIRLCRGARSSIVRYPTGEQQELVSYAGMGNATTFGIECIVFASICEGVIKAAGRNPRLSNYHVHGDDIIIETKYVAALLARLTELGFLPNPDKSFFHTTKYGIYRESCGMEALDGREVTPIRIPRNFSGMQSDTLMLFPSRISGLINLSNSFFEKLFLARLLIIRQILQLPTIYQPEFGDGNGTLLTSVSNPSYNLQHVWFKDECRIITSHGIVCTKTNNLVKDEPIRLLETLRLIQDRKEVCHFEPICVSRPKPSVLENDWC